MIGLHSGCPSYPGHIIYHGLVNQGATCYLNSVLQVLFMTRDFRKAVERFACKHPATEHIDLQLKALFDELQKQRARTCKITNKLGIDTVVYEQRDAAEYYERILTLTSRDASQIFHGELTHRVTCSSCLTEKDADAHFWHLPLSLVDSRHKRHYSVVDGIEEYFRTSHFSGENQMYCHQCHVKSDATSKCIMKHHPEVLTLLLKRFELDYRSMTYVKNNRFVVVPYTLQIPENQMYELYATVDHVGGLRGGHYTAKIKSQDDQSWYYFNDATVTLPLRQRNQVNNTIEKKKTHVADTCTQGVEGVFASGDDQCPDVVTEREEGGTEEVGDENTEAVVMEMNEDTEKKDSIGVGCRRVKPSSDVVSIVEDRDTTAATRKTMPSCYQESNEESSPLCDDPLSGHTEKQKQREEKIIKHDEEGGERGAGVEYQGCGDAGMVKVIDGKPETKPETNDRPDMNMLSMLRDEDAGGDEQFEKMKKSSLKNADSHAEDRDNEESDDVGIKLSCVEKKKGKEERGIDVKHDSEDKAGASKPRSGERQLLTICDLYCHSSHSSGSVGDSEEKSPGDDQRCQEKGRDRLHRRHVEGDKEQTRGDEEPAQGEGTPTTESDNGAAPDNPTERSNIVRQSSTEENISGNLTTPEEVPVETQAREQESKGDEELQTTEEDFQTGSEGREKVTENQGVESVEEARWGSSCPEETSGYEVVTPEVGGGSQIYEKRSEEDEETSSGSQRTMKRKPARMEPVEKKTRMDKNN